MLARPVALIHLATAGVSRCATSRSPKPTAHTLIPMLWRLPRICVSDRCAEHQQVRRTPSDSNHFTLRIDLVTTQADVCHRVDGGTIICSGRPQNVEAVNRESLSQGELCETSRLQMEQRRERRSEPRTPKALPNSRPADQGTASLDSTTRPTRLYRTICPIEKSPRRPWSCTFQSDAIRRCRSTVRSVAAQSPTDGRRMVCLMSPPTSTLSPTRYG